MIHGRWAVAVAQPARPPSTSLDAASSTRCKDDRYIVYLPTCPHTLTFSSFSVVFLRFQSLWPRKTRQPYYDTGQPQPAIWLRINKIGSIINTPAMKIGIVWEHGVSKWTMAPLKNCWTNMMSRCLSVKKQILHRGRAHSSAGTHPTVNCVRRWPTRFSPWPTCVRHTRDFIFISIVYAPPLMTVLTS